MQENHIPQELFDKIKKLINLRDGAKEVGSLAESETAAAKITELLLKYNLEEEQVHAKTEKKKWVIKEVALRVSNLQGKNESDWTIVLFNVLSNYNLCQVVHVNQSDSEDWRKRLGYIVLLGREVNVEIVAYLGAQLIIKLRDLEKEAWTEYYIESYGMPDEKRGKYRRSFFSGAVSAINDRLWEQEKAMKEKEVNITSLMIINKNEITDYLQSKGLELQKVHKKRKEQDYASKGYIHGWIAGQRVEMNKGLENKDKNHIHGKK